MNYKPTDKEIIGFINKKSINQIGLVSPALKHIVAEILINKNNLKKLIV